MVVSPDKIIFLIDVNSAYLSWEAIYRLTSGQDKVDLRTIPSAVGGDPEKRRGIILAKSYPAKAYGIQTGETLYAALQKCPNLKVVKPSYGLYSQCSDAMVALLREYSPSVQRFSVDECFMDYSGLEKLFGSYMDAAKEIQTRISDELGFTVNIGISTNKLLAKVASDLKKPNAINTLFPHEIQEKLWALPVDTLFGVGRATKPKLNRMGIYTVGELANADLDYLLYKFKSYGHVLHNYANGIDNAMVRESNYAEVKGIGNSTTISYDVTERFDACMILFSLTEKASARLRAGGYMTSLVSVSIRHSDLTRFSHQKRLYFYTDSTLEIYRVIKYLFDEAWDGEAIRHLGVRLTGFIDHEHAPYSMFEPIGNEKNRQLDHVIDEIRSKFGSQSIVRGSFIHSGFKPLTGGVTENDYPMMASML